MNAQKTAEEKNKKNKQQSIKLPDNGYIFIAHHAPGLFDRAEAAANNNLGVVSCLLSAAAVEAFANDMMDWYEYCLDHHKNCASQTGRNSILPRSQFTFCNGFQHKITQTEIEICNELTKLEENRGRTLDKINAIRKKISFNDNSAEWQKIYNELRLLFSIRDGIMHAKGEKLSIETHDKAKIEGYPDFLGTLQSMGLVNIPVENLDSWLNVVDTNRFAKWCNISSKNTVDYLLKKLPDSEISLLFKREANFEKNRLKSNDSASTLIP